MDEPNKIKPPHKPHPGHTPLEAAVDHDFIPEYDGDVPQTSYEHAATWGAYKGHVKGMLGGLFIGGGVGGLIGAVGGTTTVLLSLALASNPFGWAVAGAATLVGMAIGMYKGAEEFGSIRTVSGGVGVALDNYERRHDLVMEAKFRSFGRNFAKLFGKEEELAKIAPEMYEIVPPHANPFSKPGDGPHMASATAPTTKLFHWKTALIGLGIGLAVGALAVGGFIFAAPLLLEALPALGIAGHALELTALAAGAGAHGTVAAVAGASAVTGLFGATFGIDRSLFRRTFDVTDHWFSGELFHEKKVLNAPVQAHSISAVMAKDVNGRTHVQVPGAPAIAQSSQVSPAAETSARLSPAETFVERVKRSPVAEKDEAHWRKLAQAQKAFAELDTQSPVARH